MTRTPELLLGFGLKRIKLDRWEAYKVTTFGDVEILSQRPESKARALARALEAFKTHYVFEPRARRDGQ
jgi:hypothetical protein